MVKKSVSNQNNANLFLRGLALFVFIPSLVSAQILTNTNSGDNSWKELSSAASSSAAQPSAAPKPAPTTSSTAGQAVQNTGTNASSQGGWGAGAARNNLSQNTGNSGNVQIKPVTPASSQYTGPNSQKKEKEEIRLYMSNFRISKTLSGSTTCSMSFYLKSTLSARISNLSYRLKWAKMETPLSFDDVEPFSTVYQKYTLLGDGCYTMDTPPNVIVNRCRAKDMTQESCASKIKWIQ